MSENDTINYKEITILLVDDDTELLSSNSSELKEIGFNVICAENGKAAIEILRKEKGKIKIMIIDYFMPNLSGEQVVAEVRKFDSKLVILLQTGFAGDKPAVETLENLDIQGYHDKLKGFDELLVWVISCVRTCQQQEEIENLYSEVILANNTIEGLKRDQLLLIEETRLSTLGQLVNGIPDAFDFYSKQAATEVYNLENYLSAFLDDEATTNNTADIIMHEKLEKSGLTTITSIKKYAQNIEKIIEFIQEKEPDYKDSLKYSNTITYDDLLVKFITLIKSELQKGYNCEFRIKEESLIDIGKYQFSKNPSLILQVLQNIVINCAKLINTNNEKNKASDEQSRMLNINVPIISFEANARFNSEIEFYITVPFSNLSTTTKQALKNGCSDGGLGVGLFTAELILKENFNGGVSFKEIEESKASGGIIFKVSIPAKKYKFSPQEV